MTGYDNKRLDGRNKKKNSTTTLLYVYTITPLQQYQYVPKETVRHQASCEEVRRASQVSRVLLYSSNSNGVFAGRVSRAYVQHFMMPGTCCVPDAYDTRYVLYRYLFIRAWVVVRMRAWEVVRMILTFRPTTSCIAGGWWYA